MPKGGRKRTQEDYEREIVEAAKRIRKHGKESLAAARDSGEWLDFLDSIGIATTQSSAGQDFWGKVRGEMPPIKRQTERRQSYSELREVGIPPKLARQARDWSAERQERLIENWQSRY